MVERTSRIPGFYKMALEERLGALTERGMLSAADAGKLAAGLPLRIADQMIENAIGVLGLPLGLGLNFVVNGREYAVPMAIEEPSVIAAVSHAAKIVRGAGGFEARCEASVMIGQVQLLDVPDLGRAGRQILAEKHALLDEANALHPKMAERGGGAKDLELRVLDLPSGGQTLVVHLLIDCRDAMGANLINTMAEGIAPRLEALSGGRAFLRILSNLADRRVTRARCRLPFDQLAWKGFDGERVARGIAAASEFAEIDPYRAATHNKGVMNGISAVCIATGNDWRALEAGAHAYACRDGRYGAMATWRVVDKHLIGELAVPMQIGTVGGPIKLHPVVQIAHKLLGDPNAAELSALMGAVGLAQNMAALKALATTGIQRGHMSLHARSVAATAGAATDELDDVVALLIEEGEVKVERARSILAVIRQRASISA